MLMILYFLKYRVTMIGLPEDLIFISLIHFYFIYKVWSYVLAIYSFVFGLIHQLKVSWVLCTQVTT